MLSVVTSAQRYQVAARELDAARLAILSLKDAAEITAADVANLRREVFADGSVSRDEADALFVLENSSSVKCAEWTGFFVEALTDHVVWQLRPTGVVNESQAEWLIAQVDNATTLPSFALLINVLAEAHRVPLWFLSAVKSRASRWPGLAAAVSAAVDHASNSVQAA